MKHLTDIIIKICKFINEDIFGSPWTFLVIVIFVIVIYILLFIQGYERWNTGAGLFGNTTGSNAEFIIDSGIAVTAVSIKRSQVKHKKTIEDLHSKLDLHSEQVKSLHDKLDKLGKK